MKLQVTVSSNVHDEKLYSNPSQQPCPEIPPSPEAHDFIVNMG